MFELSRDVMLALLGAILAIVLIVLDKAGKLRGPALLILLAAAAAMALPLAVGNGWVSGAPSNVEAKKAQLDRHAGQIDALLAYMQVHLN